jgi:NAD-dependent deacetylase sirtuin 4
MTVIDAAEGDADAFESVVRLLTDRQAVVLSGAGCSTESGIPDYRGPEGSLRKRSPVQYGDFVRSEAARRRYWARSTVGWHRVVSARPNPAHVGIARLERAGIVSGVITQNVDGLHQAAGSGDVVELHGSLARVACLACGARTSRTEMQSRLEAANPGWLGSSSGGSTSGGSSAVSHATAEPAPDGDVELGDVAYDAFDVPACGACGGVLKPDVVFFGENVPKERVEDSWAMMDRAGALLVVGSSLTVYSGRRFVYGAVERGLPIAVVNLGPTRADEHAMTKVEGRLGDVIPRLAEALDA